MESEWTCPKHPEQPVSFICTGNVWHFEPMCNLCVPDHTKNHPKHIKVQLEALPEVVKKATDIKSKVHGIFEERLYRSAALLEVPSSDFEEIKCLEDKRKVILDQINGFFDRLISDTQKQKAKEAERQRESLHKLMAEIEKKVKSLKGEGEKVDVGNFCREMKTYYFKDSFAIYVEEYDEIINEYEDKVIKFNQFVWPKDLETKCANFIKAIYKIEEKIDKPPPVKPEKEEKPKKETKRKEPQRKRCPHCREEMEYLTEWKKHLVCRNCGSKERNYVKRGS